MSDAHIDFMIGSGETDVDGVLPDGSREAVLCKGEWAFSAHLNGQICALAGYTRK